MDRKQILARMEAIVDGARRAGRDCTAAERAEFDDLEQRFQRAPHGDVPETRGTGSGGRTQDDEGFTHYLRTGDLSRLSEVRADGTGFSTAPNSGGAPAAGPNGDYAGYLVPQGFWAQLAIALKAYGGIINDYKLVETNTGNPMPWPATDPTGYTGHVLGASSELTQLSVEQPFNFGQGFLSAWTLYAGPFLASLQLVQDSVFDVDQFVADRAGEGIGRKLAQLAVSGTGSAQPEGIIPSLSARGASSGASGGYYALTAAQSLKTFTNSSTTELAANALNPGTLAAMVGQVDPAYWPNAKWYMNATMALNQRTVVDSNGRPIINFMNGFDSDAVTSPNYNSNAPIAKMLGFPVIVDNNLPSLVASTVGGPVFGDLSRAMVYRRVKQQGDGVRILRLNERYADYLAVGYLAFLRADIRSNDLRAAITVSVQGT
jgi:HK97 family phage major capsid protein